MYFQTPWGSKSLLLTQSCECFHEGCNHKLFSSFFSSSLSILQSEVWTSQKHPGKPHLVWAYDPTSFRVCLCSAPIRSVPNLNFPILMYFRTPWGSKSLLLTHSCEYFQTVSSIKHRFSFYSYFGFTSTGPSIYKIYIYIYKMVHLCYIILFTL